MEFESTIRSELRLRNSLQVPPSAPSVSLLLRKAINERRIRRTFRRGLYWFLRKSEIPVQELLWLTSKAYPELSDSSVRSAVFAEQMLLAPLRYGSRLARVPQKSSWKRDLELKDDLVRDPKALRIADWTAALMIAFDERWAIEKVSGFQLASFGLCETSPEQYKFGICIFADQEAQSESHEFGFHVQDYTFPIVIYRGRWMHDSAAGIHPANGTAACWAISGRPQTKAGFLTASHLVDSPLVGKEVSTTVGVGHITDIAPPGIDAMTVAPTNGVPSDLPNRVPLTSHQLVTAYKQVEFWGMRSGQVITMITSVTDLFGTLSTRIPARVFIAKAGQEGDSGAMIRDASGYGVGLYTDRFVDMAGREHGMGMHLAQVANSMKLTLYDF